MSFGYQVLGFGSGGSAAAAFITASGGTETTSGDFKIHTFTGPGTFTVCSVGNAAGSNSVDYLVIAGGGGAGANGGGGGGAGGYRFSNGTASGCYSAGPSPLGASALPVSAQGYPISVGAGGARGTNAPPMPTSAHGVNGAVSTFSSITSAGGGFGVTNSGPITPPMSGGTGGSGGGSRGITPASAGNTPPTSPPQGNAGGAGLVCACVGAGGGGAGGAGGNTPTLPGGNPAQIGGTGGVGLSSSITGSAVPRASGATGGGCRGVPGVTFPSPPGGAGDGGTGGGAGGENATANTGGGGGGGGNYPPCTTGGIGGSGIVIIRYKFQ